jgi:hypothetical protein
LLITLKRNWNNDCGAPEYSLRGIIFIHNVISVVEDSKIALNKTNYLPRK